MRQRRVRRNRRPYRPVTSGTTVRAVVSTGLLTEAAGWVHPLVDRIFAPLLRHPWRLLALGVFLGVGLVAWSLVIADNSSIADSRHAIADKVQMNDSVQPTTRHDTSIAESGLPVNHEETRQDLSAMVSAYNQASIAAAQTGNVMLLAPYLAPEGTAWMQARAEYMRRAERGELQQASLVRWGVLEQAWDGSTATITTQEQWDVMTSIGETVISSRRGVVTRNVYTLIQDDSGSWRIVAVATTTLVA